jgi:CO/xanthine dehydrogenase FAD-binding subunit/carbon monoxide dehydrogenase subunit G
MNYTRADSLTHVGNALALHAGSRLLAGGQSMNVAMRLGLVAPETLIDLQDIAGLAKIFIDSETLSIGSMCTHDAIARGEEVRAFCPMLSSLANGIADQQVRNRGTIGGSIANNDPAACWPTALLALNATIITTQREIPAAQFFMGVYQTALRSNEIVVAIQFPKPISAHYIKFEQAASRFALVGVVVARFAGVTSPQVCVAITGLGHGVVRWPDAEHALSRQFDTRTLEQVNLLESAATSDIHASAAYRTHLSRVLARRCVAAMSHESTVTPLLPFSPNPAAQNGHFSSEISSKNTSNTAVGLDVKSEFPLSGTQTILAANIAVWNALFAPQVLQRCIPGAESVEQLSPTQFRTRARVGVGMIAVKFVADIHTTIEAEGERCLLTIAYEAGSFGAGTGAAHISLTALSETATRLDWRARAAPTGKLAQLGNRLIEASTQKLSAEFFQQFNAALVGNPAPKTFISRVGSLLSGGDRR